MKAFMKPFYAPANAPEEERVLAVRVHLIQIYLLRVVCFKRGHSIYFP